MAQVYKPDDTVADTTLAGGEPAPLAAHTEDTAGSYEDAHGGKKQGVLSKIKDKAKHVKEAIKREFGKSDPSAGNQTMGNPAAPHGVGDADNYSGEPVTEQSRDFTPGEQSEGAAEGGRDSLGDFSSLSARDIPEDMQIPVAGDATPMAGVQDRRGNPEPEPRNVEVLGKDFDFPHPNEDAISGKDEKTAADIAKAHGFTGLEPGVPSAKIHGIASPIDTSAATEPATEMIGKVSPYEPPIHSQSRDFKGEPPLTEEPTAGLDQGAAAEEGTATGTQKKQHASLQDEINEHLDFVPAAIRQGGGSEEKAAEAGQGSAGPALEREAPTDVNPGEGRGLQIDTNPLGLAGQQPAFDQTPDGGPGSATGGPLAPETSDTETPVSTAPEGVQNEAQKPTTLFGMVGSLLAPVLSPRGTSKPSSQNTNEPQSTS